MARVSPRLDEANPGLGRGRAIRRLRWLADAVLYSYSQILFTQSRAVGALLLGASFLSPRLGAAGLAAVLASLGVVRLAGFSLELAGRGNYGYNPLLVGLALASSLAPSSSLALLLLVSVAAVVYLQTALESALGYFFNLPVLSLPFVLVTWAALSTAPLLSGLSYAPLRELPPAPAWAPEAVALYLRSLGAIFFDLSPWAGLLVFAALLVYSRIGALLSVVGFLAGWLVIGELAVGTPVDNLAVAYNPLLVAVALGGVWFVPQRSSFAFAAAAALLTAFLAAALKAALWPLGLPVLILPFNLAMLLALYAMRQRVSDRAPKSVDFAAGAPEVNLNYYRTRVARFGAGASVRLALPFSGRWTVTQGVDGEHTHREAWRHALDFEVTDAEGANHAGSGAALKDYYCYRLPVCAPADGTVIKVVADVPDNAPGRRNPADNWGNLVLLQHGVGLYSLVCHLSPATVEVWEGQLVRRGARLGLCGNSGRSFVPHLHFQLQSSPRVGAPTREMELFDVITDSPAPTLHRSLVPSRGAAVRNLERKDEVASLLSFPLGSTLRFEVEGGWGRRREETVTSRIDLFNQLYLEGDAGDRLYYENQGRQFLCFDYFGSRESALYLLYAALARVPFEHPRGLVWDDVLSRRHFRPRWSSWLHDLIDPFLSGAGERITFAAAREGDALVVTGNGTAGGSAAETLARCRREGPAEVRLSLAGTVRRARLLEAVHEAKDQGLVAAADAGGLGGGR